MNSNKCFTTVLVVVIITRLLVVPSSFSMRPASDWILVRKVSVNYLIPPYFVLLLLVHIGVCFLLDPCNQSWTLVTNPK